MGVGFTGDTKENQVTGITVALVIGVEVGGVGNGENGVVLSFGLIGVVDGVVATAGALAIRSVVERGVTETESVTTTTIKAGVVYVAIWLTIGEKDNDLGYVRPAVFLEVEGGSVEAS